MLTAERLRSILSYDPETGRFRWRWDASKKPNINSRDTKRDAGHVNDYGRRQIKIEGRLYYASRLAWLYVHGTWPPNEIDHRELNRADDRIENLRCATRGQNQANVGLSKRNSSGRKGVWWNGRYRKWQAEISVEGRKIYLGRFNDVDDAAAAYARAAKEFYGDFARIR